MSVLGRPRRPLLLFLLLIPSLGPFAGAPASAAGREPAAKDDPAVLAELPQRHRQWLEEVALLASPEEHAAFLALQREYQRDAFIRRFWQVRDPYPETGRNEFQEAWEARAQAARERYGDLTEDRARMLLLNGPPGQVVQSHCPDVLLPLELWGYDGTDRIRGAFTLVFYQPQGALKGRYRLWYPTEGPERLLALSTLSGTGRNNPARLIADCSRGEEILGYLGQAIDWGQIEARGSLVPKPGAEWLASFLARSTDLPEGAAALPARLEVSFPSRRQSRTVVQGVVSVPKAEATLAKLGERTSYDFVVDGEVLRKGELFEQFRYRFSLPEADTAAATIPLVFERSLRPGSYRLVLKLEDTAGKRFFRDERDLEVPSEVEAPAVAAAPPGTPAGAPAAAADPRLAEANAAVRRDEATVRILPPGPGLKVGTARVEATATGEGIAKLTFELDGKPVLSKGRPPYSVELNLGNQPRTHVLRVRALGAGGDELGRDELLLNAGPHRFSLRLVEPQSGHSYKSSLRAQAEVEVPEGEALDRVEFFLNEARVATLYQKPFVQPILLPAGEAISYVRAVAYLADGNSTEDVALINGPEYQEEIDVDLVEVYTSVVDKKGRPVEDLGRDAFRVFEDGVEQRVSRFERVRDLPIYAGVLLDTSASMVEELEDAVRGALRFFETVLTPKDRAAVITFNDKTSFTVPFTNDRQVLAGGLANLVADGNTALYDSLIQTLYYFGGIKGKRAVILLSDGRDEGSRYSFDDALEYARRSGVALYTVGLNLVSKDGDVRVKLHKLAEETGGRAFLITRASELEGVYKAVESEIRSQYFLAYQSTSQADRERFRTIEVKLAQPGLEAKTTRGYYP